MTCVQRARLPGQRHDEPLEERRAAHDGAQDQDERHLHRERQQHPEPAVVGVDHRSRRGAERQRGAGDHEQEDDRRRGRVGNQGAEVCANRLMRSAREGMDGTSKGSTGSGIRRSGPVRCPAPPRGAWTAPPRVGAARPEWRRHRLRSGSPRCRLVQAPGQSEAQSQTHEHWKSLSRAWQAHGTSRRSRVTPSGPRWSWWRSGFRPACPIF